MEEGSLRCDANVSLRPRGEATLGVKTELKNMNSFRFIERGVEAEIVRQEAILRDGGRIEQETLHYDVRSGAISSLRSKEEAHDYRYFPEPDLVPIVPTDQMIERAREAIPELPADRAERLERDLGLPSDQAKLLAFRTEVGDFYERAVAAAGPSGDPRAVANWTCNDLLAALGDGQDPAASRVTPAALAALVGMVGAKAVSQSSAREVLGALVAEGGDPAAIVESAGLGRAGEGELAAIVDRAMAEQAEAVEKVRAGNDKAIGAIVGAIMRETKGRADGGEVQRLIRQRLSS
jgi:aspartyl-tRNA(Asn)/glutamyl-tRNA(Gln) amidotransferase subunit B